MFRESSGLEKPTLPPPDNQIEQPKDDYLTIIGNNSYSRADLEAMYPGHPIINLLIFNQNAKRTGKEIITSLNWITSGKMVPKLGRPKQTLFILITQKNQNLLPHILITYPRNNAQRSKYYLNPAAQDIFQEEIDKIPSQEIDLTKVNLSSLDDRTPYSINKLALMLELNGGTRSSWSRLLDNLDPDILESISTRNKHTQRIIGAHWKLALLIALGTQDGDEVARLRLIIENEQRTTALENKLHVSIKNLRKQLQTDIANKMSKATALKEPQRSSRLLSELRTRYVQAICSFIKSKKIDIEDFWQFAIWRTIQQHCEEYNIQLPPDLLPTPIISTSPPSQPTEAIIDHQPPDEVPTKTDKISSPETDNPNQEPSQEPDLTQEPEPALSDSEQEQLAISRLEQELITIASGLDLLNEGRKKEDKRKYIVLIVNFIEENNITLEDFQQLNIWKTIQQHGRDHNLQLQSIKSILEFKREINKTN